MMLETLFPNLSFKFIVVSICYNFPLLSTLNSLYILDFPYPIWFLCTSAVPIFGLYWESCEGSYLTRRPLTKIELLPVSVVSSRETAFF